MKWECKLAQEEWVLELGADVEWLILIVNIEKAE